MNYPMRSGSRGRVSMSDDQHTVETDGKRFALGVFLVDLKDTNDDGEYYTYRSWETITEKEVEHSDLFVLKESAAWQQTERLISEYRNRNDE